MNENAASASRLKRAAINTAVSMLSQIVAIALRFVIRKLMIQAFGLEIMGYNAVFTDVLSMLNLAEMGVEVAIAYNLYRPAAENDHAKVTGLIYTFKSYYARIGAFIIAVGILLIPALPVLTKTPYGKLAFLALIFVLQMLSTAGTYFLSFKRMAFVVDQKHYVLSSADMVVNVVSCAIQILMLVFFANYYIYLVILMMQNIAVNLIVLRKANREYPFLKQQPDRQAIASQRRLIRDDLKNVIMSKIGGFVLNSTDYLVISAMLGVVSAGVLANYTLIVTTLQYVILSAMATLQASLGNKIVSEGDRGQIESTLLNLSFAAQMCICIFSVCILFLMQDFILLWLSERQMLLPYAVVVLLTLNLYVRVLQNPITLLFGALGYYRYDKIIIGISALVNLALSLFLVFVTGIQGVLIGTFAALMVYWVSRVIIVYRKYFAFSLKRYVRHAMRCIGATTASVLAVYMADAAMPQAVTIGLFLIKGLVYVALITLINIVFFLKSAEQKYFYDWLKLLLHRRRLK